MKESTLRHMHGLHCEQAISSFPLQSSLKERQIQPHMFGLRIDSCAVHAAGIQPLLIRAKVGTDRLWLELGTPASGVSSASDDGLMTAGRPPHTRCRRAAWLPPAGGVHSRGAGCYHCGDLSANRAAGVLDEHGTPDDASPASC